VDPDEIAGYMLIMVIGVTVPGLLRGDQDAKTASIRMRKCRRVCDGRGAYPD